MIENLDITTKTNYGEIEEMGFSTAELRQLVSRASTITERLSPDFLLVEDAKTKVLINKRMKRWCTVVAGGNEALFQKRLSWDGLDDKCLRKLLGNVKLTENIELPFWTHTLNESLSLIPNYREGLAQGHPINDRCLIPEQPLPFQELFIPFIQYARERLQQKTKTCTLLTTEAYTNLERGLLERLISCCSTTLNVEFSIFQAARQSPFTRLIQRHQVDNKSDNLYWEFITKMFAGKWRSFCEEYAILSRLIATTIEFWVETCVEFLQRLSEDWTKIQQVFNNGVDLGAVIAIQNVLSDPHNQHRIVYILEFSSSFKLVYKPRALGIDAAFFRLVEWLNDRSSFLNLKTLKTIDRLHYGWVEYVQHEPCQDQEMAQRYYSRVGMLLCLIFLLDGTDCHIENMIACGEQPVPIDLETLFHHRIQPPENQANNARYWADILLHQSVLRTGLLPRWEWTPDGNGYDISGLGWLPKQGIKLRQLKWQAVNSNNMRIEETSVAIEPQAFVPMLNEQPLVSKDFIDDIILGFQEMYRLVLKHRDFLIQNPGSPLQCFQNQKSRFIFRNTKTYYSILDVALQAKHLREGVDLSIELDVASCAYLEDTKPLFWSFLREEKNALIQLDIPRFMINTNDDVFTFSDGSKTDKNYFVGASFPCVITRMKRLSEKELQQQCDLIHISLEVRFNNYADTRGETAKYLVRFNKDKSSAQFTKKAVELAEILKQQAIHAPDGSNVSWVGLKYVPKAGVSQIVSLKDNLHSGHCGIALFLTAVAKVTGRDDFYSLALKALKPLHWRVQSIQKLDKIAMETTPIGGAMGFGSMVYALTWMSYLMEDDRPVRLAKEIAELITHERIVSDSKLDVMDGAAGCLLGLLTLYKYSPTQSLLEKLQVCGHHLLENRTRSETGLRAWPTVNGYLPAGFSHGAAGITYALLRLYTLTKNKEFRDAAIEGINYENSLFSSEKQNWPNLLAATSENSGDMEFNVRWCHGAPGIGLARLGSLSILETNQIHIDIENAIETSQKAGISHLDNLCCGNFGRLEFLLTAAHTRSKQTLFDFVEQQTREILGREEKLGSFCLPFLSPGPRCNFYQLGFFHGITGVGYQLLRTAHFDKIPSVLLWESTPTVS